MEDLWIYVAIFAAWLLWTVAKVVWSIVRAVGGLSARPAGAPDGPPGEASEGEGTAPGGFPVPEEAVPAPGEAGEPPAPRDRGPAGPTWTPRPSLPTLARLAPGGTADLRRAFLLAEVLDRPRAARPWRPPRPLWPPGV